MPSENDENKNIEPEVEQSPDLIKEEPALSATDSKPEPPEPIVEPELIKPEAPVARGVSQATAIAALILIVTITLIIQSYGINKIEPTPDECRMVENALLLPEGFAPYFMEGYGMTGTWLWSAALNGGWLLNHYPEVSVLFRAKKFSNILWLFEQSRWRVYADPIGVVNRLRWVNVVATILIVIMSYLLAIRLSGRKEAGLAAAAIICVSPFAVNWGSDFHPDQYQTLMTAICLYFCLGEIERRGNFQWVWAAVFAGTATATRFIMVILWAPLVFAIISGTLKRPIKSTIGRIIGATMILFAAYLIVNPYPLTNFNLFAKGIATRFHFLYSGRGLYAYGASGWRAFADMMFEGVGYGAMGLAAAGLIWGLIKRSGKTIVIALAVGVYCALLFSSQYIGPRYGFTIAPLVAALAGTAIAAAAINAPKRTGAFIGVILLVAALMPIYTSYQIMKRRGAGDTRTEARRWIYQNVPAGSIVYTDYGAPLLNYDKESIKRWKTFFADRLTVNREKAYPDEFFRDAILHEERYMYKRFCYLDEANPLPAPAYFVIELTYAPNDPIFYQGAKSYWAVLSKEFIGRPQKPGINADLLNVISNYGTMMMKFPNENLMGDEIYIYKVDLG